jgi:rhodanese-related sulfurtransferase
MAHKTGFTARTLAQLLADAGFAGVTLHRDGFALWARGYKPA